MKSLSLFKTKIQSPIGIIYLLATDSHLVKLDFSPITELNAKIHNDLPIFKLVEKELDEYFKGERKRFSIPIQYLNGTDFQKSVWNTLRKIPYGKFISYEEEAIILGDKKKCRAVGSANGKNPIAIIIPCHRIIRKTGELGGFSGGLKIKKFLLNLEKNQ